MGIPARDREAIDEAIVRGSEALKQAKLADAQRAFRQALEIDPDNTKVLALLGLTFFRGSQFGEARAIYEELVSRSPTDASHRLNLGLVYLKLGAGQEAIVALEASRSLDPSQGRAVSYLGLAYARAGRYTEAYRSFLVAGQNELASEIEINLTTSEREQIHAQLGRTPAGPLVAPAPAAPGAAPAAPAASEPEPRRTAHTIARADTGGSRKSGDLSASAAAAVRASDSGARPGAPEVASPEITITPAPSSAVADRRLTESQVFVLPTQDQAAPAAPLPGQSMVSLAVAAAAPATPARTLTASGGTPPRPLSELATEDLVRPADGDEPFEIAPGGALVMRVTDRVMTRLEGVHVTGGDLSFEPATRRSRGHQTEERFDHGASPLYAVAGHGYLVAAPGAHGFAAVLLDDDILYLREDLVFAFEGTLRWENGNVPGLRGRLPIVQFRGDGALVIRTARPLLRVKLPPSGVVLVDAARIAGWIGRVIPRAVVPAVDGPLGAMCVECTGEGIVLVEPAPEPSAARPAASVVAAAPRATPAPVKATPPPPPSAPAEPPPAAKPPDDASPDAASPDAAAPPAPADVSFAGDDSGDTADAAIDRLDEL